MDGSGRLQRERRQLGANNDGDCFYNRQSVVKIMHFPRRAATCRWPCPNLNVGNGLTNSWPRWSPALTSYHGHAVLWATFSSNRDYGLHLKNSGLDNYYPPEGPSYDQPQPRASRTSSSTRTPSRRSGWRGSSSIPIASLDATDRSYPAFWLPFQDVTAHNHSAQWVAQVQTGSGPGRRLRRPRWRRGAVRAESLRARARPACVAPTPSAATAPAPIRAPSSNERAADRGRRCVRRRPRGAGGRSRRRRSARSPTPASTTPRPMIPAETPTRGCAPAASTFPRSENAPPTAGA